MTREGWRIGIDASLLGIRSAGIGRYCFELISRLIKNQDHEWYLYIPQRYQLTSAFGQLIQQPNVRFRETSMPIGRVWRLLWVQTILPWLANRDRLDLFWGTAHRLPIFLPSPIARVVTIHDLVWRHAAETMRPFSRFIESILMPQAVRSADIVLADSKSTADALYLEFPKSRKKVRRVSLGATALTVPKDAAEIVRQLGLIEPFFLFVGTLEPRKNLNRLLTAIAQLPQSMVKRVIFAIAGGQGWGHEDIEELAVSLNIDDRVHLLGYVTDEQLNALYSQALFLAMPSLYEGFGLPLLEAMHCGTPVLTSNCSSLPEIAGDAGILVDPYSISSIRDGLAVLLGDNEVRASLAFRAKNNAGRFSWERTAHETMSAFCEAVAIRKGLIIENNNEL